MLESLLGVDVGGAAARDGGNDDDDGDDIVDEQAGYTMRVARMVYAQEYDDGYKFD